MNELYTVVKIINLKIQMNKMKMKEISKYTHRFLDVKKEKKLRTNIVISIEHWSLEITKLKNKKV